MSGKNANLRTEFVRLTRRAGVSGWPRLCHSAWASRQTGLQPEFSIHAVCSWLRNSQRIAQQSYLPVTEDDFAKAAVAIHKGGGASLKIENIKKNLTVAPVLYRFITALFTLHASCQWRDKRPSKHLWMYCNKNFHGINGTRSRKMCRQPMISVDGNQWAAINTVRNEHRFPICQQGQVDTVYLTLRTSFHRH